MPSIADKRLLAAMKAVNPPVEKLMADRLALRQEVRQVKHELDYFCHQMLPNFIGAIKVIVLGASSLALLILALALFKGLFEIKVTATLFASLLLPIWIVDRAEAKFGRWVIHLNGHAEYIGRKISS